MQLGVFQNRCLFLSCHFTNQLLVSDLYCLPLFMYWKLNVRVKWIDTMQKCLSSLIDVEQCNVCGEILGQLLLKSLKHAFANLICRNDTLKPNSDIRNTVTHKTLINRLTSKRYCHKVSCSSVYFPNTKNSDINKITCLQAWYQRFSVLNERCSLKFTARQSSLCFDRKWRWCVLLTYQK